MAEQGPGRPVSGGAKGRQKEEAEEERGGEREVAGKEERRWAGELYHGRASGSKQHQ